MAEQNRGGWRTQNAAPGPYVPRSARGVNSFRLAPPGLEPPLGVPQPVTLAVGLQDVHPVRQAVQDRPGQPLAPVRLRPRPDRQVGCYHQGSSGGGLSASGPMAAFEPAERRSATLWQSGQASGALRIGLPKFPNEVESRKRLTGNRGIPMPNPETSRNLRVKHEKRTS